MISSQSKSIFVVGSKPSATFPEHTPDVIIAANGAIKRVQHYCGRAKIIGIIANTLFMKQNDTLPVLSGCEVDELIVIDFRNVSRLDKTPLQSGIKFKHIEHISRLAKTKTELSSVKLNRLLLHNIKRHGVCFVTKELLSLLIKGKWTLYKTSTGIFGIIHAIKSFPDIKTIYAIGIGLNPSEGHFYSSDKQYGSGHIMSDAYFIDNFDKMYPAHRLFLMDNDNG